MTRLPIAFVAVPALLMLSGCHSATQQTPQGKTVATPIPAPIVTGTDAQKKADEDLWREVEKKRRKSKSANLNKTKAYQNYIP